MDPAGFYRVLAEFESSPRPWMQDKSAVKRIRYKGKCVWIPRPDTLRTHCFSSDFEREAYDFAMALDPTLSFPADTEIVPGFERGDIIEEESLDEDGDACDDWDGADVVDEVGQFC